MNRVYDINRFMNMTAAYDQGKYERLKYVTENFQSLQGLTWAAIGGYLALSETENIPGVAFPWWLRFLMTLLGAGLALASVRYIPRYYERRFGSVEWRFGPPDAKLPIFAFALVVIFLIILFFGPALGRYLDSVTPQLSNMAHRMISDPNHRANLKPALLLFVLLFPGISGRTSGLHRLRVVVRCACLLSWIGLLMLLPLRHPEVTQQMLWRVLNACWFGISFMLWGLYDHFMLVHLLPARGQTRVNE
jgi:hypothetical protein